MSNRPLLTGDAVMIYIDDIIHCNPNNARTGLGFIRFIGFIPCLESRKFTQSIGIELIEKIHDGHAGKVNNMQYFNVQKGYGTIVPITNIIKILSTTELMLELKRTIHILQAKNEYIQQLESIISNKKTQNQYIPQNTPKLLTRIDVNMAPHPQLASARNTFILPEPITPITPSTPNSPSSFPSNLEYDHFEQFEMNTSDNDNNIASHPKLTSARNSFILPENISPLTATAINTAKTTPNTTTNAANYVHVNTPSSISTTMSISTNFNEASIPSPGTYKSRKSFKGRKSHKTSRRSSRKSSRRSSRRSSRKMSLNVFIPNEKQKPSEPISPAHSVSSPLTPITPMTPQYTPSMCYSPNILHEEMEHSEEMSFAKRMESLRKKPVPEPRRNEKKKKKKSKKMKSKKVAFQNNVHFF